MRASEGRGGGVWRKGGGFAKSAAIIGVVAGIIGVIPIVLSGMIYVGRAVNDRWLWRDEEYAKLRSLKAGATLAFFEQTLGRPLFSNPGGPAGAAVAMRRSPYRESTFGGRDYWVQTLSRRGVVSVYAVTSCDDGFQPTFDIPGTPVQVTLRKSRLAGLYPEIEQEGGPPVEYSTSGTTGYDYFYEIASGGNPSYYKTFLWGVTDACPDWGDERESLDERGLLRFGKFGSFDGLAGDGGPVMARFRESVTVNTYVESAPNVYLGVGRNGRVGSFGGFHVGPDRLLIRTTD